MERKNTRSQNWPHLGTLSVNVAILVSGSQVARARVRANRRCLETSNLK